MESSTPQHEGAAAFECHILTLFPGFFVSPLEASIIGRAIDRGEVRVEVHDIRDHAEGKHRVADDTPYGGGAGMVMKPEPVVHCLEAVEAACLARGGRKPYRVALTPAGAPFTQATARRLLATGSVALICGRYEGFDERTMAWVDEQVSLGDFVLSGGEPAALAIFDAMARLVPGVLGNAESAVEESFGMGGLLEYPQYTRPAVFRGAGVPQTLVSGDHARVARWRRGQALLKTLERRPELLENFDWTAEDRRLLEQARLECDSEAVDRSEPAEEEP